MTRNQHPPKRLIPPTMAVAACLLLTSACSVPMLPVTVGSLVATGKGLDEHAIDLVTGEDCRFDALIREDRDFCEPRGSPRTEDDFRGIFAEAEKAEAARLAREGAGAESARSTIGRDPAAQEPAIQEPVPQPTRTRLAVFPPPALNAEDRIVSPGSRERSDPIGSLLASLPVPQNQPALAASGSCLTGVGLRVRVTPNGVVCEAPLP